MDLTRRRVTALAGVGSVAGLLYKSSGLLGTSRERTDETPAEDDPRDVRDSDGESGKDDSANVPDVGEALETFDDRYLTNEAEWSYAGEGAIDHVTDDVYRGSRSLRVDNTGEAVEWIPSRPVDLSGVHFSLAAKLPAGTAPDGQLRIRLDDEHDNTITYTNTHSWTSPVDEKWTRIDFGLPGNDIADVDLTGVRRLRINTYDAPGTLYFDDVRTVERPDKGYLILEIDNPEGDDEDWFFDVYDRYGFPFTAGVDGVLAERAENVTIDRLLDAERRGHEIASKPTNGVIEAVTGMDTGDLTQLTRSQQREVIRFNRDLLRDAGFRDGTHAIVYTHNNFNRDTVAAAKEYHSLGRTGGYGAYAPTFTAPFALPGDVTEPPDETTKERVDRIVEEKLVYHLYWHVRNVSESELDDFFAYVDKYVRSGDLEVITYSDLAELRDLRS